ncbi:hypothetical protein BDW66DRAFT_142434 [Aspergillus desertorum]
MSHPSALSLHHRHCHLPLPGHHKPYHCSPLSAIHPPLCPFRLRQAWRAALLTLRPDCRSLCWRLSPSPKLHEPRPSQGPSRLSTQTRP